MKNQGELKLFVPIMVNGAEMKAIAYDFDVLTVEDIVSLNKGREKYGLMSGVVTQELDPYCQFALFKRAAIAKCSWLDEKDLERMSAKDGTKAMRLARDFFLLGEESEDLEAQEDQTLGE